MIDTGSEQLLTTSEVAQILGIGSPGVCYLINAGRLPAHKVGTTFLVAKSALDAFLPNRVIRSKPNKDKELQEEEKTEENYGNALD